MDRSLPDGVRFGQYVITAPLGAGGMGEVYRARDEQLDREVAVKVLPASSFGDPAARARLVREAKAAAALNHPSVCTVYQVGEANGQAYIAMELVDGRTLSALLEEGSLPIGRVLRFGQQLAEALTHAHERGIIHRDLKTHNVIVTPDDRVKVLDFGLAKRAADADVAAATESHLTLTQPGTAIGTLAYMAPEQLRGEPATALSDIWALGVVLYEMAAGRRPFTGQTSFELSAAILNEPPPPLPSWVPPPLGAVIARCLARDGTRYQSASDVRAALAAVPRQDVDVGIDTATARTRTQTGALPAGGGAVRSRPVRHWPAHPRLRMAIVATILAASVAAGWRLWPAGAGVRTLAVLPFENRAGDEDFAYLCEGLADSLIKQTSRLRAIRVSNLATVLNFRDGETDPRTAGQQLGVETILAGSLERRGPRLLVTAQLVDVASGREIWSRRYDRDAGQLLDMQEEIARAIMDDGLRLRLSSEERQALVRRPTTDGDAYDLYLQSRFIQRRATEEDYLYARELLQRAIVRDPHFALAYATLAGNYAMTVTDGLERPTDAWPQVGRYVGQALAIDADLPEAYSIRHAEAFLFHWDWEGAARARERLMQYPVGDFDPQALRALALEHWALGRPEEALQLARRTRELDPLSSYLAILEADYMMRTGEAGAAVALYERAIRLEPDNPNSYFGLAEAHFRQGRFDEAIRARREAHDVAGDRALLPAFEGASGEEGYRRVDRAWIGLQLEALQHRAATSYVSPLDFARTYAQLGEVEDTFRYLDRAFVDRSPGLVFLKVDRAWDAVRDDPRFAAAVRRVNLP